MSAMNAPYKDFPIPLKRSMRWTFCVIDQTNGHNSCSWFCPHNWQQSLTD